LTGIPGWQSRLAISITSLDYGFFDRVRRVVQNQNLQARHWSGMMIRLLLALLRKKVTEFDASGGPADDILAAYPYLERRIYRQLSHI
jgi:hypothetical protein